MTISLQVRDIATALEFQREVLSASAVYSDPDFAFVQAYGAEWILPADHTYHGPPLEKIFQADPAPGAGIELHVPGCDPDQAASAAHKLRYQILVKPTDMPHGLREAHLIDPHCCVWVPDVHTK